MVTCEALEIDQFACLNLILTPDSDFYYLAY